MLDAIGIWALAWASTYFAMAVTFFVSEPRGRIGQWLGPRAFHCMAYAAIPATVITAVAHLLF